MERQNTDIRQEQIKQAVLDIIYTDGLKNLSTRNLANRIGMSEGAIFRHFSTKQDIIFSIIIKCLASSLELKWITQIILVPK